MLELLTVTEEIRLYSSSLLSHSEISLTPPIY
jgi:hypothetical protein